MHRHLVILGVLLTVGCGGGPNGGDDDDDDSGGGGDTQPTCEDACRFAQDCDPEEDLEECLAYCACAVPLLRPEFDAELWSCFIRSCETSEDACFTEIAEALGPSTSAVAFTDACMSRRTECGNAFNDDMCFGTPLADDVIDEADTCLAEDCGAVSDCIVSVIATCK